MNFKILLILLPTFSSAKSKMDAFIVGGREVSIDLWPFIAFIESTNSRMMVAVCGGSLLSSQTVLTAAHCLDDITDNKREMDDYHFTIYMGHSAYHKASIARRVKDYETPPQYDPDNEDVVADIGVMFLHFPVKFLPNVKKVILFDRRFRLRRDRLMVVAGWGKTAPGEKSSTSLILKAVRMVAISAKACKRQIPFIDVNLVVCTAPSAEYAYSGDSGGPLVKRASHYQIGIVSFRHEDSGVTVFTSVPEYYDWINETQFTLYKTHCKK
ncbi:mast cell protease 4-like [Cydia pomonella]|uniref:mast cell protease 4-like n=1 Tax=Cydia pomonella TaxID=82600 RepID=UPI002ADD9A68|nr:mast cell protease 4-like [Cydia pomonella]